MMKTSNRPIAWLVALAIACALPFAFFNWTTMRHSGFALTMFSEIGLMIIFALSYNMQMGQAGLLSFGHAVLFGLSGYSAAHAMNAVKAAGVWFPLELIPLVGGIAGLGFGVVFGYLATRQRATAFAMITMGLAELVGAAALMFMTFFGGESGITTDRAIEASVVGFSYTASWQVYYLVVFWAFVSTLLMRLHTQTPLGKMANAQRDNFERAQFVGYDPRLIRFYQFVVSGLFAGIAGSLYAVLYEIVTFDALAAAKSSTALLASYIGGVGGFFGPIIGAIVVVLLQSGVSLLSNAWVMYVGVLFIVMVMYAPGGISGLLAMHAPLARTGRLRALVWPYAQVLVPALLLVFGFVLLVELSSFMTIGAEQGKQFKVGALSIEARAAGPWLLAGACLLVGGLWLRWAGRRFGAVWNDLIDAARREEGGVR